MAEHKDDEPVMFGFSSTRNTSMRSSKGGEEIGYTWGEWRDMSEKEQIGVLIDAAGELVDVWIEDNE